MQVGLAYFASLPGGKGLFWANFVVITAASIVASQVGIRSTVSVSRMLQLTFNITVVDDKPLTWLDLLCRPSSAPALQSSARCAMLPHAG